MELREAYGELRVEVGTPVRECRATWLHWNQLLHPDRVDGSAADKAMAEDQLKLINEAWDVIKSHDSTHADPASSPGARRDAPSGADRRPTFTPAKATLFLVEEVHLLANVESAGKPLPERWTPLLSMPYDELTPRQLTKIRDLGAELAGLLAEAARTDPQVFDAYRAACGADEPPAVVALFDDYFNEYFDDYFDDYFSDH